MPSYQEMMSQLKTEQDISNEEKNKYADKLASELAPGAPKDFDIWSNNSYKWFTGSDDTERQRIPYITLIEFENRTDVALQRQLYIHAAAQGRASRTKSPNFKDLYDGMYVVVPTGRSFRIPYLGKHPFALQTAYSMIDTKSTDGLSEQVLKVREGLYDSLQKINDGWNNMWDAVGKSQEGLKNYIKMMANNPDHGTEGFQRRFGIAEGAQSIKKWTSAEGGQFSTKFILINDTGAHISNHYFFIRQFIRAIAPAFPNTMQVRVPYIYEIYIPSQLHIPLGFIGKFTATPKGTMYMANKKMIIPEAWEIDMSFNSLFPISKQLLDTIDDPVGSDFGFNTSIKNMNPADGRYSSIIGAPNYKLTDEESYQTSLKQMMGATMSGYNIPSE